MGIWISSADQSSVDLLRDSGAKLTRIILGWSSVEREQGAYDFSNYDDQLTRLGEAGINTIVEIRGNPAWASSRACGPTFTTAGRSAFGPFLRALAERYSGPPYNVKLWEFYNEPDTLDESVALRVGLGCWALAPAAEYVDMLRAASESIKAVDPTAKIVFGGLAYEGLPLFDNSFLDNVLQAGGGAYFDVANLHYYSSQSRNRDYPNYWVNIGDVEGKAGRIRAILANRGTSKPVVVTEMGWTPDVDNDFAERQARYVVKVMARGASIAVDLYGMNWFTLKDWPGADRNYGLTDINGQPKLAYHTFQYAATSEFGRATLLWSLNPTQVGVSTGIEGYVYVVGGQERWVLWARSQGWPQLGNDGDCSTPILCDGTQPTAQASISLPSRTIQVLDKLGQQIAAGGGQMAVGDSPVYIHLNP